MRSVAGHTRSAAIRQEPPRSIQIPKNANDANFIPSPMLMAASATGPIVIHENAMPIHQKTGWGEDQEFGFNDDSEHILELHKTFASLL